MTQRKEFRNSKTFFLPLSSGSPRSICAVDTGMDGGGHTDIPQGPPRYCQRGVIHQDDQRTLWYTDGPLELIQLEEVLEPATHPQQNYQREDLAPEAD